MEQVYGLGVSTIQFVQEWFEPYEGYFTLVNELANQYHVTETLFPLVSVLDSVFASQLLLCIAFGSWLNAVMKWWILEDRPYWWVRETSYYADTERPQLKQTHQTCETGPGCPSGHSATMALTLTLLLASVAHVATDRQWKVPTYIQKAALASCSVILGSVFLARMYVAAHFPHQVLLGGIVGMFLGPALCIYVSDPYIWQYGRFSHGAVESARRWHVASALGTAAVAVVTYWGLVACDQDPQLTIKLAFRWCEYPEHIHHKTTPVFSLVQSCGYLLGWAIAVTPAVAKYRHDTKERSLIISAFLTYLTIYTIRYINDNFICKNHTFEYYSSKFVIFTLKPMLFLRIIPSLAMWPYSSTVKVKTS